MPRFLNRYFSTKFLLVLLTLLILMSLPGGQNSLWSFLRPTASAASTFTVNSNGDTGDSNPGDGVCNDGTLACTLRAAIQEANALAGDDTIVFHASVSAIALNTALPDITSNVNILGPGATLLTIQRSTVGGTPDFRILTIGPGLTVILSKLTLANGKANGGAFPANSGGGIYTDDGGTVFVSSCVISGNDAALSGGGIYNRGSILRIDHSTISNNTAAANGAGVNNNSSDNFFGGSIIRDSTISNNVAGSQGGGIYTVWFTEITNSTISTNSAFRGGGIANFNPLVMGLTSVTVAANNASNAGGGIYNPGAGTIAPSSTLIANNTAPLGPDCSANNISSQDYNLIGNTSGANFGAGSHDQLNINPLLGPLAANGGPTLTHALLSGSPAIDAAITPEPLDQRGQSRMFDDPNTPNVHGTNLSDIGAYEASGLLVNSTADADDGACTPLGTGNGCSLREAISAANAETGVNLISFASALTAGGPATITLSTALPDLAHDLSIVGPGANLLTVQRSSVGATPNFRIFTISSALTVSISGLTVTNGRSADGTPGSSPTSGANGGGILNGGNLTLANVVISGNRSGDGGLGTTFAGNGGKGGGIANTGTLTMTNCTVSGNSGGRGGDGGTSPGEGGHGGGIANFNTLTMTSCIVNGNNGGRGGDGSTFGGGHGGNGGGIYFEGGTANAAFTSITVSNNTAGDSGNTGTGGFGGHGGGLAILHPNAVVTLVNSSVAGNSSGNSAGTDGFGGGIMVQGTLSVTGSTVSGNTSAGPGGGIIVQGTGIMTLGNSTVSGNNGQSGGGIYNDSSTTLTLVNATITGNSGNGVLTGAPATIRNSIVAGNSGAGLPDVVGPFNSQGHNLVGNAEGSSGFNAIGDQVGSSAAPLNPRLGPLANNGGPTRTHALLVGSPALDAGDNCVFDNTCAPPYGFSLTTDQRGVGFARKIDGPDADTTDTVDIGAFEAQVSVADLADQTINEDASLSLPFNVGGAASITSVTASSSNTTLVPNTPANISISGSGSSRTLTINPAANLFGTSTITVTVNGNNGQTMTDTFLLTVNPVNDAPSFTKGPDVTVLENSSPEAIQNWASNISAGPVDEGGQTVSFVLNNSNPGLFAVAPAVTPAGLLSFSLAVGASGTAHIAISLMDNGGTANGGSNISAPQSFDIIVRDGGQLQFSAATYSAGENAGNAVITVTRTGASAGEAQARYAISNGTATAGEDYSASIDILVFAEGETSKTFNVPITNDTIDEPDETVNLTLTNAFGTGSLGTPTSAALTITDNDPPPSLSINDVAVTEGNSGTVNATFTVSLSAPSAQTATVNFATANGTATAGSDYTATSGSLTFLPLETTKPVTVTVNGDGSFEANESFSVNLSSPVNASLSDSQGSGTITNDDAQGEFISFSQANYTVSENAGSVTITVTRSNDLSGPATVDYATADDTTVVPCATANGVASSRCDFTTALGTLRFAAGESTKTFLVLISQDSYVEGAETLTLTLSNLTGGAALATPSTATLTITDDAPESSGNPIDIADAFVRQHYHDFLNREADAAGLAFWTNQITECQQPGSTCSAAVRRINVSAAFFLSIEFQETGYFVYRTYKSGYGNVSGTPVPLRFAEFLPDTQQIGKDVVVGAPGAEQQLENNKVAYLQEFVARSRFTSAYPSSLTPAQFVEALFTNAGVMPSVAEQTAAIAEFGGAGNTTDTAARARALRRVADNSTLKQQETNKAFVLMQYFGYLRRNPNDAPEANLDFGGYNFWLGKLDEFNGNFVNAEMVKAFLVSGEYRQRFGP